jgi:hypothetical protein
MTNGIGSAFVPMRADCPAWTMLKDMRIGRKRVDGKPVHVSLRRSAEQGARRRFASRGCSEMGGMPGYGHFTDGIMSCLASSAASVLLGNIFLYIFPFVMNEA